jgi:FkbM family methyltransferase
VTGWLAPLARGPAKHLLRIARDPEYRTWCGLEASLGRAPRFEERRVRVHGLDLTVPDPASFLSSYHEIFVERTLDFPWPSGDPRVLDLGANIGLSVLALKRRFPRAAVTAVEPDPNLFEVLARNVHGNGFSDVTLVNRAAWREAGKLRFSPDGADGGTLATDRAGGAGDGTVEVEALDLPALLREQRFDFMKMDIEGAEREVVPACAGALDGIRYLFVEYHGAPDRASELAAVVRPLEEAGFRIQVHTVRSPRHPFLEQTAGAGCDLILHIYGARP